MTMPTAEEIHRRWNDEGRARFCRGLNPEQFLAELQSYGWSPSWISQLERNVRDRMINDPTIPIIEHMMDAAIEVQVKSGRPTADAD
jgi:hypothetical protein